MGFSITDMLNKDTSMAAAPVKEHAIERISYSKLVPSEDNFYSMQEIEELKKRLERKEGRLDSSRDEILRKAREEAQTVLREAKEYADETIRSYNKLGKASGSAKEMERERTKLREKMNALQKANGIKADQKPKKTAAGKRSSHR